MTAREGASGDDLWMTRRTVLNPRDTIPGGFFYLTSETGSEINVVASYQGTYVYSAAPGSHDEGMFIKKLPGRPPSTRKRQPALPGSCILGIA